MRDKKTSTLGFKNKLFYVFSTVNSRIFQITKNYTIKTSQLLGNQTIQVVTATRNVCVTLIIAL